MPASVPVGERCLWYRPEPVRTTSSPCSCCNRRNQVKKCQKNEYQNNRKNTQTWSTTRCQSHCTLQEFQFNFNFNFDFHFNFHFISFQSQLKSKTKPSQVEPVHTTWTVLLSRESRLETTTWSTYLSISLSPFVYICSMLPALLIVADSAHSSLFSLLCVFSALSFSCVFKYSYWEYIDYDQRLEMLLGRHFWHLSTCI